MYNLIVHPKAINHTKCAKPKAMQCGVGRENCRAEAGQGVQSINRSLPAGSPHQLGQVGHHPSSAQRDQGHSSSLHKGTVHYAEHSWGCVPPEEGLFLIKLSPHM